MRNFGLFCFQHCLVRLNKKYSGSSVTANLPLMFYAQFLEMPEIIAFHWWNIRDLNLLPVKSFVRLFSANALFCCVYTDTVSLWKTAFDRLTANKTANIVFTDFHSGDPKLRLPA